MEDTRKNVRSEYKMVGKWGFVPKLGAVLLAALIILSLASCKNSADGGVGYSDGGGAPVVSDSSGKTPLLDGLPDDIVEDDSSLGVSTYKFFVDDDNQIGPPRGVKLQGEVTFAKILEKANLNEDDYKDEFFDGWKVRGSDGNAIIKNDRDFSVSTDFMAVYRDPPKYKDHITKEDVLGCDWYSSSEDSHLLFTGEDGGEAYEVKGLPFTAAQKIINDYREMEKDSGGIGKKYTTDEVREYANTTFSHQYSWMPDEYMNAWNNDWEIAKGIFMFDYMSGYQVFYYVSPNGNELLTVDADGNTKTVYEKIKR